MTNIFEHSFVQKKHALHTVLDAADLSFDYMQRALLRGPKTTSQPQQQEIS